MTKVICMKKEINASQGIMKKETNGQSAEIQLNSPGSTVPETSSTPSQKRRSLKIDSRQRQIDLFFPIWNYSCNPMFKVTHSL